MTLLQRSSFVRGWMPDVDDIGAPVDALLRADNLVLDRLGTPAVRAGSAIVSSGLGVDVHSLFTIVINGTRYRFAGVDNTVYANGSALVTGVNGSADITFGAYRGQVLMARGTTKKKYDGTTVRNWGLSMTGGTPTVAGTAPDSKTFASCNIAEAPAFTLKEGDPITFATGQDGTANGSIVLHPNATSNRGTIQKVFAAETDFTTYDAGTTGSDDDLITLYVYVTEPNRLLSIDLLIDVNGSSTNPFQDDYYAGSFQSGVDQVLDEPPTAVALPITAPNPPGVTRRRPPSLGTPVGRAVSQVRTDKPVANAGWSKLAIRRSQMLRIGATLNKGWNTVKAIELVVTTTLATDVQFDTIKIEAARHLGPYKWAYVLAYNSGLYVGLSAPSALSAETFAQTQKVTVTVPADANRDSQFNEIWLYRIGGLLDDFFRVAVKTGVTGVGAITIDDTTSDRDALLADLRLEADNGVPPDSIIGLVGPYYDRVFALTAAGVYPSRQINPDSFASGQVIAVGGPEERAYWIARGLGGIYVGTSHDVYRLEGSGAELPDGTVEFEFVPLNLAHPPVSDGVAKDGNAVYYMSADGWRGVAGTGSTLIVGATSLLYRGEARYGVGPVTVIGGRFRTAISKGQLVAITPEAGALLSSGALYRHRPDVNVWYRHIYDRDWRSLYAEADGTLLAGNNSGQVWQLDTGTTDNGVAIPVTLWTKVEDDGAPFNRKDPIDLRVSLDTGGATAAVALHLDASATAGATLSATQTGEGVSAISLDGVAAFRRVQLRLTGGFTAFRFFSYALDLTALPPPFVGTIRPTDGNDARVKTFSGFEMRLCTLGQTRTITPLLDGVAQTALTVGSGVNDPTDVTYMFPAPITGVDFALLVDGDIELYKWTPLVTTARPLGVRSWDSGPIDLKTDERIWLRELRVKVIAGADITATPYFDGVAWPSVTLPVGRLNVPDILIVFVGRAYVGKVPRLVLTSTAPFYPYWVECVRRSTGARSDYAAVRVPAEVGRGA